MTRLAVVLALVLVTTRIAHADPQAPAPEGRPVVPIDDLRRLYEQGDYEGARKLLLDAYAISPQPALLFALGQVELNLGHYQAAIDYYEKFLATGPDDKQAALAQQAIGAARIKLAQPTPTPVPPPPPPREVKHYPPRRWYTEDTGLVALGGAALAVGGGLLYYSHRLASDQSGSLSDFDDRIGLARTTRWTAIGVASAGALLIGVTVLRWQLRPDGGVMTAQLAPGGLLVSGRW